MRHAACFGLSIVSMLVLAWGCGDDSQSSGSTGDPPIPCEADRDCRVENPCVRGFCEGSRKECVFRPIESGPQPGAEQIPGDCLSIACVAGEPAVVPANDPPDDDGVDCFVPTCDGGEIGQRPSPAGSTCQTNSTLGLCNNAGVCSCAPVGDNPQFVDPVAGSDSPTNGGGPGACAYRTLSYALGAGVRDIRLKPGTYSAATGETLPFVLTGQQRLICFEQGSNELATIVGSGSFESSTAAIVMNGNQNRVERCVVEASGADYGIAIASNSNNGHQVRNADVSGAAIGIGALLAGTNASIRDTSIHDNTSVGLAFLENGASGSLENNTFANNALDVRCADASPDVTGTNNGSPSCQVCGNCPF